jgi:hypothetical protein
MELQSEHDVHFHLPSPDAEPQTKDTQQIKQNPVLKCSEVFTSANSAFRECEVGKSYINSLGVLKGRFFPNKPHCVVSSLFSF